MAMVFTCHRARGNGRELETTNGTYMLFVISDNIFKEVKVVMTNCFFFQFSKVLRYLRQWGRRRRRSESPNSCSHGC